jgi:lipoate---protein ligase
MRYLDLTLPTAAKNLALDEALLLEADAGRSEDLLRVWHFEQPAVILGAGCSLAHDVDEPACRADGVPILRRASGGGTVLLGSGCLLFSLILGYDSAPGLGEIGSSYRFILTRLLECMLPLQPGIDRAGTSDLAAAGRKFSGNAQQRKRRHLLHHGTLLYDFDLASIGRYLRTPERQPEYRAGREHREFVMNLPASEAEIKRRLRQAWRADEEIHEWPEQEVRRLVEEKYSRPEWTWRR